MQNNETHTHETIGYTHAAQQPSQPSGSKRDHTHTHIRTQTMNKMYKFWVKPI